MEPLTARIVGRVSDESTAAPPRPLRQRVRDTLARLDHDIDAWVATADPQTGAPYLVPLSFMWDGSVLLVSTRRSSPTGRNLLTTREVCLGIGPTRDVVLIHGTAREITEIPQQVGDAFAARTGFDPRDLDGYRYYEIEPRRIQAWREANELDGRDVMRDGSWLDTA